MTGKTKALLRNLQKANVANPKKKPVVTKKVAEKNINWQRKPDKIVVEIAEQNEDPASMFLEPSKKGANQQRKAFMTASKQIKK